MGSPASTTVSSRSLRPAATSFHAACIAEARAGSTVSEAEPAGHCSTFNLTAVAVGIDHVGSRASAGSEAAPATATCGGDHAAAQAAATNRPQASVRRIDGEGMRGSGTLGSKHSL
jgi:hypothetical protein